MKYLMFIKHSESSRNEPIPQALMDAMGEFVAQGFKDGTLKDTAGLKPTKDGFQPGAARRASKCDSSATTAPVTLRTPDRATSRARASRSESASVGSPPPTR